MSTLLLLLVQVLAIVALSRVLGLIAARLGQPTVVGEMVAGILLGPSLLGWVAPATAHALFPSASLVPLNTLGQLGLVLFMFLVGLRVDTKHLREGTRNIALLALCGTLIPFALGCAVARLWLIGGGFDVPHRWLAVLFVGLAMSVTAFPVLARILESQRLQHTRIGAVAISCAAVDDATAWLVLAVLTAIAGGTETYVWQRLTGLGLFVVMTMFVARPLVGRQLERTRSAVARLGMLLIAVIASAATTEAIGLHAFFGAFFVGAVLARDARMYISEINVVEPLATVLLLPVYFAFTGLRTDVTALTASPTLATVTAALLLVAIISKVAPPVLLANAIGFSRRDGLRLGFLLNTRGMVGLVVLNVGLETGLVSRDVYSALVVMAIVTTAMTSPLLLWVRRREESESSGIRHEQLMTR